MTVCHYSVSKAQTSGIVEVDILEEKTEDPLTCRIQILDEKGRKLRARGAKQFELGWNLVESPMVFRGRPGKYTYRVFRGPQFAPGNGEFLLDKRSEGLDVLRLPRHADLEDESWLGGDLASRIHPKKSLDWLDAEDLVMAACLHDGTQESEVIERNRSGSKWVEDFSFLDDRAGSGLALHHWSPPAEVPDHLPSARLLVMATQKSASAEEVSTMPVHAEIKNLWARDVPIWLASERVDSIQVLSSHLTFDGKGAKKFNAILEPDPGKYLTSAGQPRDATSAGKLIENLYWKVLDAGLRIPPSAGSDFGKRGSSPLGYNRVYTSVASLGRQEWWTALRAGRSFVTNGPLLRTQINGQVPGAVFRAEEGGKIDLNVALTLTVADPVDYLDVIFNGEKLYEARLDQYAKAGGKIPSLTVEESGWLVVRVVTGREHTYRIAMTAPYYCEVGSSPRISESAVSFFQSWLEKSTVQIAKSPQAKTYGPYLKAARKFWADRKELASAP